MPEPDAIAVVAPCVVPLALRCCCASRVAAQPSAEGEIFDIVVERDRKPRAARPLILWPLMDRDVVIPIMAGKFHWEGPKRQRWIAFTEPILGPRAARTRGLAMSRGIMIMSLRGAQRRSNLVIAL